MKAKNATKQWKKAEKAFDLAVMNYNNSHLAMDAAINNMDYDRATKSNLDSLLEIRRALQEMLDLVQITIDTNCATVL